MERHFPQALPSSSSALPPLTGGLRPSSPAPSARRMAEPRTVVLTSADASFRQRLRESLVAMRWTVREAGGGAESMELLGESPAEALVLDTWLPDLEVVEFAARLRLSHPEMDLLQIDQGQQGAQSGARSPRRNELLHALHAAQDHESALTGPSTTAGRGEERTGAAGPETLDAEDWNAAQLAATARGQAVEAVPGDSVLLSSRTAQTGKEPGQSRERAFLSIPELVGDGPAMRELARLVRLVAPRSATVLLEGETGTGKEVVARAIHRLSLRSGKPFAVLNCAAIPESLLEAELFGHTRGAFTGAVQSRTGRIEAAHGGTLLLDEIGEMPIGLQAKLLRFLECGELQRVGENEPVRVDVRVIAATHEPLEQRSREGRFRFDLYYRLAVFPLRVPSLAERMEDLPLLAEHFLAKLGEEAPVKRLGDAAMRKLMAHNWPGNVRELAHALERATILSDERGEIGPDDLRLGSGRASS